MMLSIKTKLKEKKTLIENFLSLTILQGANFILPLISLPYLVKTLELNNFGLIMFAQAIIVYFSLIVEYGFNLSATREISIHQKDKNKISLIFTTVMIIKILLIIVSLLLLSLMVFSFEKFRLNWELYYLSFGLVLGQSLFPVWFFQGIEKMKYISILNIIAKSIFTILIFIVIKDKEDYLYVPILNSLGYILAGLISLYIIFIKFDIKIILPSFKYIKLTFRESTHLFISKISVTLYSVSNIIILGFFATNELVGIYSSIEKLVLAIKSLYMPLYQALFPWLSKKTKIDIQDKIKKMILPIFVFSSIITIILYIYAEALLTLLYGKEEVIKYYNLFQIMSLISIFSALNMLFNMLYLTSIKAYKERMIILLNAGVINILVVMFLTSKYSLYGTAIGVTFTEFTLLIFGLYFFKKFKMRENYE